MATEQQIVAGCRDRTNGPVTRGINRAAVSVLVGIVWWLTMIGSHIAADLRDHQPKAARHAVSR
jgi:hypothetical protein